MSWNQILDMYRQILTHTLGWRLDAGPGRTAEFTRGQAVFSIDQGLSPTIFRYRLQDTGQVVMSGFAHTLYSSVQSVLDRVKQKGIMEFAPSPDRGDDGEGSDQIHQLANRWWNAADPQDQKRIADVIRSFGYEITQVESEDDAVQLTDIQGKADPIFISADEFDPDLMEQE